VHDVAGGLREKLQKFLTFQLSSIIRSNSASVSVTFVIAVALTLWSASGGIAALITGIHVAREHDEPRSLAAKRGKALLLTFAAIAFLGISKTYGSLAGIVVMLLWLWLSSLLILVGAEVDATPSS
jgi:membrane protein